MKNRNLKKYVNILHALGYDVERILAGTGLSFDLFDSESAEIGESVYVQIMQSVQRDCRSSAIGFEIGAQTSLSSLGILGPMVTSAQTLKDATDLWARYSNRLLGIPIKAQVSVTNCDYIAVTLSETIPLGSSRVLCFEEYIASVLSIGRQINYQDLAISRVDLAYPAPRHADIYADILKSDIIFSAPHTRILIASPNAHARMPDCDASLSRVCQAYCERMPISGEGMVEIVECLRDLFATSQTSIPDLEKAAGHLRMSPRTLRRRLQEAGYTYRRVVGDYRIDTAKDLLASSTICTKQISSLLGYKDVNAFRRAFKLQTGGTTREYRRSRTIRGHPQASSDSQKSAPT